MDSNFWSFFVLLLIVGFVAACIGYILGSICATVAIADRHDPFQPKHREYEHECDAHYPRIGE